MIMDLPHEIATTVGQCHQQFEAGRKMLKNREAKLQAISQPRRECGLCVETTVFTDRIRPFGFPGCNPGLGMLTFRP